MAEPPSVFFIGDVSEDSYFTADRWPGLAHKAYVAAGKTYVGGMIANAACVFAGLGGRPEFISLLNDGPLSDHLCASLERLGVSTRHMLRDPGMGESRNLIFLTEGEHVVLTVDLGRAPMHLGDEAIAALRRPGYLYSSIYRIHRLRAGNLAGVDLFADLRACGRKLVVDLDVEGFAPDEAELLRGAEAILMNRAGFARSFGDAPVESVHRWMADHEVRLLVRTLAAEGAELYADGKVMRRPALRVPVVDVTGGGDTFGGALLYGLVHGLELGETLDLALAAASRAVTIEGPQGGIASLEMVRVFRATHAENGTEGTQT